MFSVNRSYMFVRYIYVWNGKKNITFFPFGGNFRLVLPQVCGFWDVKIMCPFSNFVCVYTKPQTLGYPIAFQKFMLDMNILWFLFFMVFPLLPLCVYWPAALVQIFEILDKEVPKEEQCSRLAPRHFFKQR